MTDFMVTRTTTGAEWKSGNVTATADAARIDKGEVKVVLTVTADGDIVYQSNTNLTSMRARARRRGAERERGRARRPLAGRT